MFMKLIQRLLFLVVGGVFSLSSYGQEIENSMLWSVSGNGLKHTSYLFGTIHVICASDFTINDKVVKALELSDQLYLELDMDDEKEIQEMVASTNGEKPLTTLLSEEDQKKLNEKLQQEIGVSLEDVNHYSLQTISSLFLVNGLSCESVKSYEQYLLDFAKKNDKKINGLETVEFQYSMLEKAMSQEEILMSIYDTSVVAQMDSLMNYYKNENLNAMRTMFLDKTYMTDKALSYILIERNKNWVSVMPKIMKKKATFFGVGSGHLVGSYGLIALLRAKGFTVEPVF